MSLSLYRKYRPQKFEELKGQEHVKRSLMGGVKSQRISHAYLFTGPRGTGKTTTARLLARALNCEDSISKGEPCGECEICKGHLAPNWPDLIEIDAASHRGINEIKELRELVRYLPQRSKYKVFIIDEVHMLTPEAFNALLKTLEEPPSHAIFILATTEPHKVPATIVSRCQRFDFRRVSPDLIVERLKDIALKEGTQVDDEVLRHIALKAEGGMRDAETMLGQILALGEKNIGFEQAQLVIPRSNLEDLSRFLFLMLAQNNKKECFELLEKLQDEGLGPEFFLNELMEMLRYFILLKVEFGFDRVANKFGRDMAQEWLKKIENVELKELRNLLVALLGVRKEIELSDNLPWLPLEMMVIASEVDAGAKFSSDTGGTGENFLNQAGIDLNGSAEEEFALNSGFIAEFKKELKAQSVSLSLLLKNCLLEEEAGKLVFTCKYPFHADKLKEIKNIRLIGMIWEKLRGGKVEVETRIDSKLILTQDGGLLKELSDDSVLKSALEIFGGEVVEEK